MTSVTLHSAAALTSHHLDHADLLSPGSCSGESSASLSYRHGESGGIIANEQITRLFPKCPPRSIRPAQTLRSDINLNPEPEQEPEPGQELTGTDNDNDNKRSMMDVQRDTDRSAECSALGLNAEASDGGASSSEDQAGGEPVIILTSNSGGTYKLRDSRIIEIAGGREVFSQSRSKAARKSRYITSGGDDCDRKRKSPSRPGVWEVRNRSGIDQHKNSGRNGPELTETMFSTEVHSVRHQRPAVPAISPLSPPNSPPKSRGGGGTVGMLSSSPPGGTMLKTVNAAGVQSQTPITPLTPPRSLAVVADGEVVVFDDIGENWQGLRLDLENEAQANNCHSPDNVDGNSTGASSTGSPVYHCSTTDYIKTDIEISARSPENKVARVIGSLPIAEYEGSPRRYRPRQTEMTSMNPVLPSAHSLLSSPSMYPPRPGFPQRILPRTVEPESDTDLESLTLAAVETSPTDNSTFDYLYEFSETRKVLEEFFKCPPRDEENKALEDLSDFNDLDYELHRQPGSGSSYVGHRLAKTPTSQDEIPVNDSPRKNHSIHMQEHDDYEHSNNFLELSVGTASSEDLGDADAGLQVGHSRNFTLSPETTDCDSNCGDLDSEVSLMLMENDFGASVGLLGSAGDLGAVPDSTRLYTSMPVLEDGLSSGHASDTDNNNPTVMLMKRQITEIEREIIQRTSGQMDRDKRMENGTKERIDIDLYSKNKDHSFEGTDPELEAMDPFNIAQATPPPPAPAPHRRVSLEPPAEVEAALKDIRATLQRTKALPVKSPQAQDTPEQTASPVWVQRQRGASRASADSDGTAGGKVLSGDEGGDEEEADTDLETDRLLGQQRTDDQGFYDNKGWRKPKSRTVMPSNAPKISTPLSQKISQTPTRPPPPTLAIGSMDSPGLGPEPLETESVRDSPENRSDGSPDKTPSPQSSGSGKSKKDKDGKKKGRNKEGLLDDPSVLIEGVLFRARYLGSTQLVCEGQPTKSTRMMQAEEAVSRIKEASAGNQTASYAHAYGPCSVDSQESCDESTGLEPSDSECEHSPCHAVCKPDNIPINMTAHALVPNVVMGVGSPIHVQPITLGPVQCGMGLHGGNITGAMLPLQVGTTGTVFRLQFLGSVEVDEEGGRKRRKRLKKNMVEEAVTKIKAPEGENQPSTEVDLFISTEKIMVLNTDLKEIMMDHALRTISYIADIGDLVVLMARRRFVPHEMDDPPKINRTPKMICHVFESEEAQFIAQSIGQAFQVAYMEFLKANGIEDHSFVKEMDYQEVLNSQEIFGDELQMFAKKEMQKEVVVPKAKGEILGVVIVESGWGSMLPTVVIANLAPAGAAARCGQLNIGDQIIAINGVSLVGLPLSTCQNYIKNSKNQTVVKLTVVPCAPVVEVKIKRPDTKYQLGFSVQNGVICSLLRGGIAERGGVRVGHRIIEINNQSVVAVPHEKIVNLLATSVGEILMKTMPTSMFRLLTGQENPVYI